MIRGRLVTSGFGGLLFTFVTALSPSSVEAQCNQWDVSGPWRFKQGTTTVELDLSQNGIAITGKANHSPSRTGNVRGTVDGYVKRDHFFVNIHWKNNTTGVYTGTIQPSGRIEGTGYNAVTPSQKVNWYSTGLMQCADAAPSDGRTSSAPADAAQEWIDQEVRKRKAATQPTPGASNRPRGFINGLQLETPTPTPKTFTPTQGEAGKTARPYIRALPQIVSIPNGDNEALTKLVWFAGNDHPDAQLVVEVDGGDEHLVDPQRKGSRQVKVKAGQKYVYTLTDNGESLASVVVQTDQPARGESENDDNQKDD